MSYQDQLRKYVKDIEKHGHDQGCSDTELLDAIADRLDAQARAIRIARDRLKDIAENRAFQPPLHAKTALALMAEFLPETSHG